MDAVERAFLRWYERFARGRMLQLVSLSLSLVARVILISGRDYVMFRVGDPSFSLPLSWGTIRMWFIPGAAGRSDKGATSESPFIFHLSPPASSAQGMTSYPPEREAAN